MNTSCKIRIVAKTKEKNKKENHSPSLNKSIEC